jgi:NAD(P)-dependent dehydrogenase (short-subunit alcohol dehydrogenase family)
VLPGPGAGDRLDPGIAERAAAEGAGVDDVRARVVKDIPLGRMPTEAEVAETVLFLASDAASGMTGQAITVCGGLRMQ